MRSDVTNQLNQNNDYWLFLRQFPVWHRILSRYPERIQDFMVEYKVIRRKRLIDKIEDAASMVELMSGLMEET
jgi:predicted MarR family transcription regulator